MEVIEEVRRESRIIEIHDELRIEYVARVGAAAGYGKDERERVGHERAAAARAAVARFVDAERELGFEVPEAEQDRLRKLLVLGDVVGVQRHQQVFGKAVVVHKPVAPPAPAVATAPLTPSAKKTK